MTRLFFSFKSVVTILILLSAVSTPAFGQTGAAREAREIGEIRIEFIDLQNVSEEVVRYNMRSREGGRYDEARIDSDIRSLYGTGLFEYIEVKRDFRPDGTVDLLIEVRPKFRVSEVEFAGNERVSNRRLGRETSIEPSGALDERVVRMDAESIHDYYQSRGFTEAEVSYAIDRDRETGRGKVTFEIEEGERVRIVDVEFTGNETISDRRLRRVMETRRWNILAFLTGHGRLKDDVLEDDIRRLEDYYREEGFLDVEVPADEVTYDYLSERHMILRMHVNEGRRYRVGDIEITGNDLYPDEELLDILELNPGDWYGPSALDGDVTRLRDYYGQDGRLDTVVRVQRIPRVESTDIDLRYEIEESERFFLESINIEGNTKTKSNVIIRELGLGPGEVFNTVRMQTSQQRLRNTRFFEEVSLEPGPTDIPDRRDLNINVREGRTGSITFGAGFSTLERIIVFAEVSQSNFDLFSPRSGFQGAGQKFRFRVQLGTRSNEVMLSFEEPWLFQRELALGFQIFRTETRFLAATYNELRTGFEVYLRKRLFELVEGRLSYRLEEVDIFGVDSDRAPQVIQDEAGRRTVSKVGFSLLRDTRDSLLVTTRGNRIEALTEYAGGPFDGHTDYYRLELRGSQFFPMPYYEDRDHVLSFLGRAGTVVPHSRAERVPFFDRYFLGGPDTLRGFRFRDVGPRENDDDVTGGNSYSLFSAEYSFTVVEPLRFAVFYDAGFVNEADFHFNPRDYNDNWGFGLRLMVLGAPLRLDYGIPITADDVNDTGGYFSFSFGTRF